MSNFSSLTSRAALVILLLLLIAAGRLPAAEVLIDDFTSSGGGSISGTIPGPGGSLAIDGDLGPQVDLALFYESGVGTMFAGINSTPAPDRAFYHGQSLTEGLMRIQWDGNSDSPVSNLDPAGLGSIDLTGGGTNDGILADVLFNDVPATLNVTVYSAAGANVSTAQLSLPVQKLDPTNTLTVGLPFSDFVGNADFSDVSALEIVVDASLGSDISLDGFRAGLVPPPVAPPTPPLQSWAPIPAGAMVIDTFDTLAFSAAPLQGGSASSSTLDPSALGGVVAAVIDNVVGAGSVRVETGDANPGKTGTLRYQGETLTTATVTTWWDGVDGSTFQPDGLGSVDLTDAGRLSQFQLGVKFNDVPVDLMLEVYSNGGADLSTASLLVPGVLTGGGVLRVAYADFIGTADFTDVSAVRLIIPGVLGLDIDLDYLVAVPEPTTAALFAVGLMVAGCHGGRRCRRAKRGHSTFLVAACSRGAQVQHATLAQERL